MRVTENCDANVVCHLPRREKAAIANLAHSRRVTVSKLVRELLDREVSASAQLAKRTKKAVA